MHQRIEQRFTNCLLGIVLLIRADNALDGGDGSVAQRQIVDRVFKLLENRAAKLLAVPELRAGFIIEYSNFCGVQALIGKKKRKVCENIVFGNAQSPVLFHRKFNAVLLERRLRCLEGQFLFQAAVILKIVTVRFFDHLTDLLRRGRNTGRALANVHAGGLHALGFQIVRLVAAFSHFNPDYFVVLENISHEHGHVRMNGIADAVGQAGVCLVYIVNAGHIALIVNADVDHAAVRICKCDDFLVNVIDHLRFIFNAFAFILHIQFLHCSLLTLYSLFHTFQYSGVKIHFLLTLEVKITFTFICSLPFRLALLQDFGRAVFRWPNGVTDGIIPLSPPFSLFVGRISKSEAANVLKIFLPLLKSQFIPGLHTIDIHSSLQKAHYLIF